MTQDEGNRLSQLFSNAETANAIFELASAVSAREEAAARPEAEPAGGNNAVADTAQFLASVFGDQSKEKAPPRAEEKKAEKNEEKGQDRTRNTFSELLDILPLLIGAMNGDTGHLPSERVNLMNAIKPYAGQRSEHIDRAMRMAGVAKAAKSALRMLGREQ